MGVGCSPSAYGILTLHDVLFQGTWVGASPEASSADYNSDPSYGARFQI